MQVYKFYFPSNFPIEKRQPETKKQNVSPANSPFFTELTSIFLRLECSLNLPQNQRAVMSN
jgi:hypothetical protein